MLLTCAHTHGTLCVCCGAVDACDEETRANPLSEDTGIEIIRAITA